MIRKRPLFVAGGLILVLLLGAFLWDKANDYHCAAWKSSYIQAMKNVDGSQDLLNETPAPEGNSISKGFHIHINLDELVLYIFKDGELLKTYPVSGGKTNTPSPIGSWKIISKDTWGEGFGGAWLGFNVPWGLYGIHGTIEPWFVGRSNSSEGCIRMKNADAREVFKTVPYGTTVKIVYKNIPFRVMQHGDVGTDILEAEKALKVLNYYNGSLDGTFGYTLEDSVRKFQKDNKLHITGKINTSTHNLINQLYNDAQNIELQ